ncbi:uncharacterized protein N7482_001341 [Penicillium canariense]|uniref:F-box domain-containing protein n=1 Tax=Penicillium canariense TaxID=189055 RepID=A0A9W9ID86_9EURO|nr:uncharacterized protein N7482_001341 [Penicillium canariense]KAJ5175464.1 hypothetical protein N7482_001341 [Penicillium canariense]
MDPDSEAQAILSRFKTLPKLSRQAVYVLPYGLQRPKAETAHRYRGVMDQLRPDEWREVKSRVDRIHFRCDFLDKLPLEIVSLVAEKLPLADIVRLQRVSRRWQQVLLSPSLCRAAARATLGRDPWAQRSASDPHAAVAIHTASSANASGPASTAAPYSTASFINLVKRRRRLEQGGSNQISIMLIPLGVVRDNSWYTRAVGYSHGALAWLAGEDDQTTVLTFDLWTAAQRKRFTTENREKLVALRFKMPLIAATSVRGYCHVWNIDTDEYSSFRIPSASYKHFLINGTKIALSYHDYVVHWSFDTKITRTVHTGSSIVAFALHPSEDQFTLIRVCKKEEKDPLDARAAFPECGLAIDLCKLHTAKYVLNSKNEFHSVLTRYQPFPNLHLSKEWIDIYSDGRAQEVHLGQTSVSLVCWEEDGNTLERIQLYLSIEPDDLVAIHTLPMFEFPLVSNIVCPEQGILYVSNLEGFHLGILKSITMPTTTSNAYVWYKHSIRDVIDNEDEHYGFLGDGQFLISLKTGGMQVWAMDERYQKPYGRSI